MKQKNLKELPLAELEKKVKTLKGTLIGLGITWIVLFGSAFWVFINNHSTKLLPLIMMPALFLTTYLPLTISMRKIKAEIKSRI